MWQEPATHPLLHLLASRLHGREDGRLGQYCPEVPIDDGPGAGLHAHADDLCHGALLFGVQSIHGRQGACGENRAGASRPAHLLLPKNPGEPQAYCAVDGEKRPARKWAIKLPKSDKPLPQRRFSTTQKSIPRQRGRKRTQKTNNAKVE